MDIAIHSTSKQSFTGWEADEKLRNSVNNAKKLDRLSEVSGVDVIRTNVADNNKYLPRDNMYVTVSKKTVDNHLFYGTDCVILSKTASKEDVSERLFKSAQNSLGKLFGKIADIDIECTNSQKNKPPKLLKWLSGLFKKK